MSELILPDVVATVPDDGLPIGEAATACGLTVDALRYYEREGLMLAPAPRNAAGQRRYGGRDIRWLAGLAMLRGTGMHIDGIRRYAELARRPGTETERLTLLEEHRSQVLAHMAETRRHLAAIDRKISAYRARDAPGGTAEIP